MVFAGVSSLQNMFEAVGESLLHRFPRLDRRVMLGILCVICLGIGLHMEPIYKWGPWMDVVSIYIIPIGAAGCLLVLDLPPEGTAEGDPPRLQKGPRPLVALPGTVCLCALRPSSVRCGPAAEGSLLTKSPQPSMAGGFMLFY